MKIAMLVEYYYPFDRGGSEWSTHDLVYLLIEKGYKGIVITPNYGTKEKEIYDHVEIIRLPFYKKLQKREKFLSPFWTNNTLWFLYSAYQIYLICKKEKIDVIHIQSRSFIVGAYLANLFLRKKLVVTFRDYQVLCNFGFCLLKKTKSCNIFEYFSKDFPFFLKNYVPKSNPLGFVIYFLLAVRARFINFLVRIVAEAIKTKICVSQRQKKIFQDNGFSNLQVIYSSVIFPKKSPQIKKDNRIVYIGKLSLGKGVDLFIHSIPHVLKKVKNDIKIKIVGDGHLKNKLKMLTVELGLGGKIKFLGQIEHHKVLEEVGKSKILVAPSVWEEPFGRVVIEALSRKTPVVVSKKGAFPEIVETLKTGIVADLDRESLSEAIILILKNYSQFLRNISEKWPKLKEKFGEETAEKYLSIYKKFEA